MTPENSASPRANFELAQKCLIAIRDIADRAVHSLDPKQMGYAIQELTQVLVERTGTLRSGLLNGGGEDHINPVVARAR